MSWFSSILGTDGVVDGIREGIDKSILTPEERLDYHKELLKSYEPFKLIQRGLAFAVTGMIGFLLIVEVTLIVLSIWFTSTLSVVESINNLELTSTIGMSFIAVMDRHTV